MVLTDCPGSTPPALPPFDYRDAARGISHVLLVNIKKENVHSNSSPPNMLAKACTKLAKTYRSHPTGNSLTVNLGIASPTDHWSFHYE